LTGIVDEITSKRKTPIREIKLPLRVGWMGNPNPPERHFFDIIKPVVEHFEREGKITFSTSFSGNRADFSDYIETIDLFISVSTMDVGPVMFVEGYLYDVPCISIRHGHAALIMQHGDNGWFIEPNQNSLEAVLTQILEDVTVVNRARTKIRRDFLKVFNNESTTKSWNDLFQYYIL
jgi:glycosyltransferase involved in cell wall biosynthesis